jgi:hypothetical protein
MLPKLHLICSKNILQPALNHVRITRQDLQAANGHVAAIVPTDSLSITNKNELPEEPIYLHFENWKLLTAASIGSVIWDAERSHFVVIYKGNKPNAVVPVSTDPGGNFPDIPAVLPRWEDAEPLKCIGFNAKSLSDLVEAISDPTEKIKNVALRMFAVNRAMLAKTPNADLGGTGLIMPIMLLPEMYG